ncbi:NUDIX hydrolase [Marinagarivorans algicola]|uniref:NUDIX hydrolase n=1 Tax=Marinagarivorans algicola TaxID=1513270 RepID=UPI000A41AB1F
MNSKNEHLDKSLGKNLNAHSAKSVDFMNRPKAIGPWQRLDSQLVYENPWVSVHHQNVITPGNTQGIYGVVHFKGTAVGVVPIDDEGNTWLVKQTRYTLGIETYEIPEGGAPVGEAPAECARRELLEEVGVHARYIEPLMTLHLSNSVTDERAEIFVATGITLGVAAPEDSEDITVLKLPLKQAIAMTLDGQITDAISVAALQRLALKDAGF